MTNPIPNSNDPAARELRVSGRRVRAFTLIEVMISLTIALLLMLGVNQVFDSAGRTIGAGNAVNEATRTGRAMQSLIAADIRNMTSDGPLLVLHNRAEWAYRNRADAQSPGTVSQFDENNDGTANESLKFTDYNFRRHRLDVMSFFVRDLVRRQTGNDGIWQAAQALTEGWVWYGHMRLPGEGSSLPGDYYLPWDTAVGNVNNRYASQWVLGRAALALADPDSSGNIKDRNNVSQVYIRGGSVANGSLGPLALNTPASLGSELLEWSRYDLGGLSIGSFRNLLEDTKWRPWSSTTTYYTQDTGPAHRSCCTYAGLVWQSTINGNTNSAPSLSSSSWKLYDYAELMNDARFLVNPYLAKPVDSADAARYAPYLAASCTQFLVEYAGDFLSQDADGNVTGTYWDYGTAEERTTDQQVDFVVDKSADTSPLKNATSKWVRRVRWYGLPREVKALADGSVLGGRATAAEMPDVVPLRDIWQTAASGARAPFEKTVPATASDYSTTEAKEYVCVWGPHDRKPTMVRILMAFDDPAGNLRQPIWFEYVYALP